MYILLIFKMASWQYEAVVDWMGREAPDGGGMRGAPIPKRQPKRL